MGQASARSPSGLRSIRFPIEFGSKRSTSGTYVHRESRSSSSAARDARAARASSSWYPLSSNNGYRVCRSPRLRQHVRFVPYPGPTPLARVSGAPHCAVRRRVNRRPIVGRERRCTPDMHTGHVHRTCTPDMYTGHVHRACTPGMYTGHVQSSSNEVHRHALRY
jgi:hypothetical protein